MGTRQRVILSQSSLQAPTAGKGLWKFWGDQGRAVGAGKCTGPKQAPTKTSAGDCDQQHPWQGHLVLLRLENSKRSAQGLLLGFLRVIELDAMSSADHETVEQRSCPPPHMQRAPLHFPQLRTSSCTAGQTDPVPLVVWHVCNQKQQLQVTHSCYHLSNPWSNISISLQFDW